MKKLIVFGGVLLVVSLSQTVTVESQENDAPPVQAPVRELPSSVINNIKVPYEVLMNAQLEYQGYAVTKAAKVTHKGRSAYRLTVDRDDQPYNNQVIYLLYDMNWQLLGEEKGLPRQQETKPPEAPPQPPAETPQEDNEQEPADTQEEETPPSPEPDLEEPSTEEPVQPPAPHPAR